MNLFTPYLIWSLLTHVWFDLITAPLRIPTGPSHVHNPAVTPSA